jgi:hypothetical protein
MPLDKTDSPDFNAAADRRAYEKARAAEPVQRKIEDIERKAAETTRKLLEERARTREQDLVAERARQRLDHPSMEYDDLTMSGEVKKPRREEDIERSAVHEVDRRTVLDTMAIVLERDEQIDALLGIAPQQSEMAPGRDAHTPPACKHDALKIKCDIKLGSGFTRAASPDRGGWGR